jgi:hypothetical protein
LSVALRETSLGKIPTFEMNVRVKLEPDLEKHASTLKPHERRVLARKFYRWAKQLWISAQIIERDAEPIPKPTLKPLPKAKLIRN